MASKPGLDAKSLARLGAPRLAELLLEVSSGDAALKRRLRLALAGAQGPAEAAREIRKRLASLAKSESFIERHKMRAFAAELDGLRRLIVEQIAPADATEAFDVMMRFMEIASPVFDRCDDSNGTLSGVFAAARGNLGAIAAAAKPPPDVLAERTFEALKNNGYGQYDGLIETLAPALGGSGLERLKSHAIEFGKTPVPKPAETDRKVIGWGSGGRIYADEIEERRRQSVVSMALQDIADLQSDVDGYISLQPAKARGAPRVAADIAKRLLSAGRAEEALKVLDAADKDYPPGFAPEWETVRAGVLDALDKTDEAQTFRWSCFERTLDPEHLRNYLKRLPDFDDVEAESRAMDVALAFPHVHMALHFLIGWPAHATAARLIEARSAELDGNLYEVLSPAAEALEGKHPAAATLLRRAMISHILDFSKSSRYRHAARHLLECESLENALAASGTVSPHQDYVADLRRLHPRKTAFWELLPR
jgi:hypothetical protein